MSYVLFVKTVKSKITVNPHIDLCNDTLVKKEKIELKVKCNSLVFQCIQYQNFIVFIFFLISTSYNKVQMESETTGLNQIISPITLVRAPHHPRPQVTSVTCAELHHMPPLLHPGRAMWVRLVGLGSITSS